MPKKTTKPVEVKEGVTLDDALDGIIGDISPKDDSFVVSKLEDPRSLCHVKEWVSTGCLPVDLCFGGGIPVGRLTEIYGDNSTGKSLLAAQAVVQAQKKGYLAVFADAESAIDKTLMKSIGVDTDRLVYFAPDTINQVFETLNSVIDSKDARLGVSAPMIFVWDSVAASCTKEEQDDQDLDQKHYASGAPQISRAFRSGIIKKMARSNVAAILINQLRANVGAMFGEKDTTYGGKAIPYYATLRVMLKNIEHIKDPVRKHKMLGVKISVETKKNKAAPPYRYVEVPIYYGTGLDEPEATLDLLKDMELVSHNTSGYYTLELGGQTYKFKKTDWLFREEQGTGLFDELYEPVKALLEQEYPKWA